MQCEIRYKPKLPLLFAKKGRDNLSIGWFAFPDGKVSFVYWRLCSTDP